MTIDFENIDSLAPRERFDLACRYYWSDHDESVKQRAIAVWEALADAGDIDSCTALYNVFTSGGEHHDFYRAFRWAKKAADAGDAIGECRVGLAYCRAQGAPQNIEEGLTWLRRAADKNDAEALFVLGRLLFEGRVTAKNSQQGLAFLHSAALAGSKQAQAYLEEQKHSRLWRFFFSRLS